MRFKTHSYEIKLFNHETGETEIVTVTGFEAEGVGLGYHLSSEINAYVVTHLESGYDLGYHLYDEVDVRKWITALAPLFDWHMQAREFFHMPKTERDKVWKALLPITDDFSHRKRAHNPERFDALMAKAKEVAGA